MALDDLGRLPREVGDGAQLARRGPDADEHAEAVAEPARVDLGAVAGDHAVLLEAPQALGHRRRRQPDAAAELGERRAGVGLQLGERARGRWNRAPACWFVGMTARALPAIAHVNGAFDVGILAWRWTALSRRTRTSSSAPSSTTSGRRSRSCSSPASTCSASRGCGSRRPRSSSPCGAGRGASASGPWPRLIVAWGVVLAAMNACFYTAIDRLPLGTVAAIEFLPVIVLAALGARTPRNAAALALAVCGVYLLTGVQLDVGAGRRSPSRSPTPVLFALYIVLADRVAKRAGPERDRRPRRVDARRGGRRHAGRRRGRRCRRSATPSRCWRGSASASRRR